MAGLLTGFDGYSTYQLSKLSLYADFDFDFVEGTMKENLKEAATRLEKNSGTYTNLITANAQQ